MRTRGSALVQLVERESFLSSVDQSSAVIINYRWELKSGQERAYFEVSSGEESYRTRNLSRSCTKAKTAKVVVREEVRALRQYLQRRGNFSGPFDCYYLKGEPQKEVYFGKL